mgnify:CR=1 FL=1
MHILYICRNKRDDASGRCHHFCGEFKKNIEAEKKIDKQKYIDKNQIKQVYTSLISQMLFSLFKPFFSTYFDISQ